MSVNPAKPLEILESIQKDEFYVNHLRGLCTRASQHIFGIQNTFRWQKELNLVADILYYGLTTLGSLQTLGEEYTGLIQVDETKRTIPVYRRRLLMVLLQTLFPFAVEKLLSVAENKLHSTDETLLNNTQKTSLEKIISCIRAAVLLLHRMHLSVFYIDMIFAQISKRIAAVEYVSISNSNAGIYTKAFNKLGYLAMLQTAIALAVQLFSFHKSYQTYLSVQSEKSNRATTQIEEGCDNSTKKCSLCLETRKDTTTTLCGHLFCWFCIHDCINIKPECPICRDQIKPNQLIRLQNFD